MTQHFEPGHAEQVDELRVFRNPVLKGGSAVVEISEQLKGGDA